MSSIVSYLHFCWVAILKWHIILALQSACHFVWPPVYLLYRCLSSWLSSMLSFMPYLYFLYDDSHSAMERSGPDLYSMSILCWWILSSVYWKHCDNNATSFLNIVTSGFWWAMMLTTLAKQSWWNFLASCISMPLYVTVLSFGHLVSLDGKC